MKHLRESVRCHGDISVHTLRWINGTTGRGPLVPTLEDRGLHRCVGWKGLNSWAENSRYGLYDLEFLRKPEQGLGYNDSRVDD